MKLTIFDRKLNKLLFPSTTKYRRKVYDIFKNQLLAAISEQKVPEA